MTGLSILSAAIRTANGELKAKTGFSFVDVKAGEVMLKTVLREIRKIICVIAAAAIYGFSIKNFLHGAGLLAGGFTGVSLLAQQTLLKFSDISVPLSLIYIPLNAVPALISFKFIGKRFTIYSLIMIVLSSTFADMMPFLQLTDDTLLCAVFGGLLNGTAIAVCLLNNATSGGTDFISIFISEHYGKDAWNYIFAGNVCVLLLSGILFNWTSAMYSIILQFCSTMIIQLLYKRYQKQTMFIITEKPDEVYSVIRDNTNHDGTLFKGTGLYKGKERNMIYSVVSSDEIRMVVSKIKEQDKGAFINIMKSEEISGNFYRRPNS